MLGRGSQTHERGHGGIHRTVQAREHGSHAGPATDGRQRGVGPTGLAQDRVVAIGSAHHRTNDDTLVHKAGDAWKDLANLDAGNLGGDGVELAANFARRFGFNVPHILVGRSTTQVDVNDRLMPTGRGPLGFGPEEVSEG